ncbi:MULTISPECIES: hypothetical protein [unclassified Exiguobacterium]|uniref:hypothetical protein n=1 Tax=unclassified Exiguobacterium TaxID=2644629 RepID=UPI001BE5F2F3|nr:MULTISPECIES: hypothetical protein [unclassified Exiguobacterium]
MTKQERIQYIGAYRQMHQKTSVWLTATFIFCNSFVLGFDTWWIWGIGSTLAAIGLMYLTRQESKQLQTMTSGKAESLTKRLYRLYSYWIGAVTGVVLFSRLQTPLIAWAIIGLGIVMLAWIHYQTVRQLRQADPDQPTRDEVTKHYRSYERSTYADEREAN